MASKRYKRKDCAYCGAPKASTAPDHVVAREFFFEEDRANLPQVPARLFNAGGWAELSPPGNTV